MKKAIAGVFAYLIIASPFKVATAGEGSNTKSEMRVTSYISEIYKQIDFCKYGKISYEAFAAAYKGYQNLKAAGKLGAKEIISVCDFKMPSTEKRLWVIDLAAKKVLFNTYVAHGQGSGELYATSFSNAGRTHKSSLGFYVTGETYEGGHGTSLRLEGMDEGYNDAAYDRCIVMHGAKYVCDRFIDAQDKLGRSWGCPAVPSNLSMPIINAIKGGTCLFIYYPQKAYLKSTQWLKSLTDAQSTLSDRATVASVQ